VERLARLEVERAVLDLHEDVLAERPSSGTNSRYARFTRSGSTSGSYTNARHITMPPCGATASASTLAPSACVRP
jgi:hypothetical protein